MQFSLNDSLGTMTVIALLEDGVTLSNGADAFSLSLSYGLSSATDDLKNDAAFQLAVAKDLLSGGSAVLNVSFFSLEWWNGSSANGGKSYLYGWNLTSSGRYEDGRYSALMNLDFSESLDDWRVHEVFLPYYYFSWSQYVALDKSVLYFSAEGGYGGDACNW